jgi:tetraacyldisaccharide 4'-kinase
VGNISVGGTGKTPVVDWLLSWGEERALLPAVLTRGYGARPPRFPWLVDPSHTPAEAGDEPLMLARAHPGALVLVDPDRNRAARAALRRSPAPDLFLLDDGFQRIATGRHLDLVLLDPDDAGGGSGWNRVLPAGTWREPAEALSRAHAFLLKTEPEDWPGLLPVLRERLRPFPSPVFAFRLRPFGLRSVPASSPELLPVSALASPYALVCGVGNPAQARRSAEKFLGRPPAREMFYPDHHDFTKNAGELAAMNLPLVCTAKDAVKLEALGLPLLFSLEARADFFACFNTDRPFPVWWEEWWNGFAAREGER